MPDQPSKESLERERQWCFLQRQNGGDTISEAVHNCQQCDPGSLYYVLAFLREELRQQNAALVEALRDVRATLVRHYSGNLDWRRTASCPNFEHIDEVCEQALAPYAPADASEKEKK